MLRNGLLYTSTETFRALSSFVNDTPAYAFLLHVRTKMPTSAVKSTYEEQTDPPIVDSKTAQR